jgi:hypothetical protein
MLARHQWLREHGTPRITTLTGGGARRAWLEWMRLSGRESRRSIFEQPPRTDAGWLDRTATKLAALAVADPRAPRAIVVDGAVLAGWLGRRGDRIAALIAEGIVHVDLPAGRSGPVAAPARAEKARSLAELTLYDALEATPATAGRFALNQSLALTFGSRSAEVDLLSRAEQVAIEVDGYHHFTDVAGYRRDRRKDLLLQAHGYAVLRFLADDVHADPRAAVAAVIEFLGRRLGRERLRRTR